MHIKPQEDSWLVPSQQADLPGRPVLGEARLHRRRESTFLVLAALFVVATATLPILGTSRVIDVGYAISAIVPDLSLPFALALPLGVLAFPLGFFAVNLVCELYGRRRANALILVGLLVSLALLGLMHLADRLDHDDAAFGAALAFTSCYVVAHVANLMIFDSLRRRMSGRHRWIRKAASTLLAQLGGWSAFAFVMYGYAVGVAGQDPSVADGIFALAVGSALYVVAFAFVDLIPFSIMARTLTVYLRIDAAGEDERAEEDDRESEAPAIPRTRKPPAMIVEEAQGTPAPRRRVRNSLQPFSSAEMRFFTEGEELDEAGESGQARA
jgi:uncharacterized integral membrane protein (TIGR00697 family)